MSRMEEKQTNILLIEDDPEDEMIIRGTLPEKDERGTRINLVSAPTLEQGLERLSSGLTDLVLLDLFLPDSQGLDSFTRIHSQAEGVPIVLLTGCDDEVLALESVRQGAQDYLVKGNLNVKVLLRAILYAIERNRTQAELRSLSLVDDLTGLYNRRGFLTFAEQYLKLAQRKSKGLVMLYADLDHFKQINDTFGHHEGDLALIRTAKILRETFRKSDIVGRVGGDEFPVIAMDADSKDVEILKEHLHENLKKCNAQSDGRYKLSATVGIACYDPDVHDSVDELMLQADRDLYEQKKLKKETRLDRTQKGRV